MEHRTLEIETLIHQFRGPLAGLLASWGVPWHDAHELTQDTFAEAFLSRAAFRGDPTDIKKVGRWLRGIARNRFRLWSRSRKQQSVLPIVDEIHVAPTLDSIPPHIEKLRSAIDQLPEKLKSVVYMHYLEESTVIAVAGLLKLSVKAIEGRLYRARNLLRDRLKECDEAIDLLEGRAS